MRSKVYCILDVVSECASTDLFVAKNDAHASRSYRIWIENAKKQQPSLFSEFDYKLICLGEFENETKNVKGGIVLPCIVDNECYAVNVDIEGAKSE